MDNKKDDSTTQQPQDTPEKPTQKPTSQNPHSGDTAQNVPRNKLDNPIQSTSQDTLKNSPEEPQDITSKSTQDPTPQDTLDKSSSDKTQESKTQENISEKTQDPTPKDTPSHTDNTNAKSDILTQFNSGKGSGESNNPPPGNNPPTKSNTPPQDSPKKTFPKWIIVALTVLLIALAGIGAYATLMPQETEPTPTPTPAPTQPATPTPEENEQTVLSEEVNLSFSIPIDWEHTSNITPEDISTDYGSGVTSPNEYATNNNGCSIYFGEVLGSGGPSNILTNESITIDGIDFNQRAWYREEVNETPFFMYISTEDSTSDHPSIWAWLPEDETSPNCMANIEETLSTVEFTDEEPEEEQSMAQVSCLENGGTWVPEHNECEGISQQQCTLLEGTFDECASQCRHEPEGTVCTEVCVQVCSFPTSTSDNSM